MRKLTIIVCVLLAMCCVVPSFAQEKPPAAPPDDVAAKLDGILDQIVNGIPNLIPGAPAGALLVRTKDWQYAKAKGFTMQGGSDKVTPEMAFQIGSNTKMMTSTIILQLHEEGQLNIDDLMSKYLPDIAARIPNGDKVTIRHLLSHRSGIWDFVDGSRPKPGETEKPKDGLFYVALDDERLFTRDYTPEELIDFAVKNGKPEFAPGSVNEEGKPNFAYCNTGYVLLGMIIEKVTGQKAEAAFRTRIFDPLGMTQSYLETSVPKKGATPQGYLDGRDVTNFNLSMAWTAGSVIATPSDMATFITALLTGKLFKNPATLALMESDPTINAPTGGDYALGLQDKAHGGGLWGHGGQTLAFESDVAYDVETGMAIVAWGNATSNPAAYGATLVKGVLAPPQPTAIPLTMQDIHGKLLKLMSTYDPATAIKREFAQDDHYTVVFNADGTMNITADCNKVSASYTVSGQNALTITLGASTLVACASDSFADQFLASLGKATTFIIVAEAQNLDVILLDSDGASLSFQSTP
ncbi:MAG: serine hydrolase [Anaerolineae bacterium]|nr:serine hydrolase [Anaerolineae bacterium]